MAGQLHGKRIAFLMANEGVEQAELTEPLEALLGAGAEVTLLAPEKSQIQTFNHLEKGDTFEANCVVPVTGAGDYDALVLPGGVANHGLLRSKGEAVAFVRSFFDAGKPVGTICHGPWTLMAAGVVGGRTLTSWPSLRTDLCNAGAEWVDREVHVDRGLVSSRTVEDLDAFNAKLVEEFAADVPEG